MGIVKEIFAEYMDYFKATFARCMFLMQALIVIWRTVVLLGNAYWFITIGIICIVCEYFVTLVVRNGQEWNWFSPATFCYLLSAVPGLWLQKLYHLGHYGTVSNTSIATVPSTSMSLDFSSEDWMLLSEQTMMVTIILSRWLLPKGAMTHNEVSQLLLLYLSLSSDIIDFLSIFAFTKVAEDETYCYMLLFWWTWSLMQFTLVLTSTQDETDNDYDSNNKNNNDDRKDKKAKDIESAKETSSESVHTKDEANERKDRESDSVSRPVQDRGKVRGHCSVDSQLDVESDEREQKPTVPLSENAPKTLMLSQVLCSSELWAILVIFFLQDGPFLANRLVVMFHFNVFNYTIIFFICKNILVLALQTYRIIVLYSESKAKVRESKLRAKAALKARLYSKVSLHSFGSIDTIEENCDDDGFDDTNAFPYASSDRNCRGTPTGSSTVQLSEQASSSASCYHPPSFSSAFVGMPTVSRRKQPPMNNMLAAATSQGKRKSLPPVHRTTSSPKTDRSTSEPGDEQTQNTDILKSYASTSTAQASRNISRSLRRTPRLPSILAEDKANADPIVSPNLSQMSFC